MVRMVEFPERSQTRTAAPTPTSNYFWFPFCNVCWSVICLKLATNNCYKFTLVNFDKLDTCFAKASQNSPRVLETARTRIRKRNNQNRRCKLKKKKKIWTNEQNQCATMRYFGVQESHTDRLGRQSIQCYHVRNADQYFFCVVGHKMRARASFTNWLLPNRSTIAAECAEILLKISRLNRTRRKQRGKKTGNLVIVNERLGPSRVFGIFGGFFRMALQSLQSVN